LYWVIVGTITANFIGAASGIPSAELFIFTLHFGLLGKYPIQLGEKIALFPAAGIEYQSVIMSMESGLPISLKMILLKKWKQLQAFLQIQIERMV